jgi:predicted transcriptional regulator
LFFNFQEFIFVLNFLAMTNKHLRKFFPASEVSSTDKARAIGHSARLRILLYLWGNGSANFDTLSDIVQESVSSCSFHIKVLVENELIFSHLDLAGKNVYSYNFKYEDKALPYFKDLIEELEENQGTRDRMFKSQPPGRLLMLKSECERKLAESRYRFEEKMRKVKIFEKRKFSG